MNQKMPNILTYTKHDDSQIYHLVINDINKNNNYIDQQFIDEFNNFLSYLNKDEAVSGLIISSDKEDFILGTSLDNFITLRHKKNASKFASNLSKLLRKIEDLPFRVIAMVNGRCLGSGLDLALACTNRICTTHASTLFGFTEISVGLIPFSGGIRRLIKTIGLQASTDMVLTGRVINHIKAKHISLVDLYIHRNQIFNFCFQFILKSHAHGIHNETISSSFSKELPKWAIEGNPIGRKVMYKRAKEHVDEKTKGFYPASYKALDLLYLATDLSREEKEKFSIEAIEFLIAGRESQALLHLEFCEDKSQKDCDDNFLDLDETLPPPINEIGLIGAGQTGTLIATLCIENDFRVHLNDCDAKPIGKALQAIQIYLNKKVDKRVLKSFELSSKMSRLVPSLDRVNDSQLDIILDTTPDDLNIKKKVIDSIDFQKNLKLFFVVNAAIRTVHELTKGATAKDRILGCHFLMPIAESKIVEVCPTSHTSKDALSSVTQFFRKLGKIPIIVADIKGFFITRVLVLFLSEAILLLLEGARVEEIDCTMIGFGFLKGPFSLIDEIGLKKCLILFNSFQHDYPEISRSTEFLNIMVKNDIFGGKSKDGFYRYQSKVNKLVNHKIYSLGGIKKFIEIESNIILDRCLMIFIKHALCALDDGVIKDAYDGDLAAVHGLGFPPSWGGPFKYVDLIGADEVCNTLKKFANIYGERFIPSCFFDKRAQHTDCKFFLDEI